MRRPSENEKLKVNPQEGSARSLRTNHGTTPPQSVPEGWLWVGQVGRPHGVRGAFFLKTEDNRTDWPGYSQLLLKAKSENLLKVEKAYCSGGKLALQLVGIQTREAAEELYNAHLFVERSQIILDEGEYLVAELVGCDVEVEGREGVFGRVVAVHDFGAQETLEILPTNAESTIYFPFIEHFIVFVDQHKKIICVKDESAFLDEHNK